MEQSDGKLLHSIGLDLNQLKKDVAETKNLFKSIGDNVQGESTRIDRSINKIGATIATVFTVQKAQQFANEIINVRGEIESLETSYRVLLGSKEKSDKMLSEMKNYSIKTPLTLMDISNAGQTLLQFGIEGNRVMPIMRMLGDVSAGNTEKFQRLSLAFGQMSSTGHLMGQDLLQMINAGFNPLNYISEETGKSINVLRKEMEGGRISTEMVEKAFAKATGEGGKFHNMLEKQSHTINGLKSNLKDIITNEFNEIGKANEGLIKGGLEYSILAVKNYKEIGSVIGEIIAAYGIYRAALVSITVVQEVYAVQTALAAMSTTTFTTAQIAGATATNILSAAMARLNVVIMANPYALAAAAIATLAVVTYDLATAETEAEKAANRLTDSKDKYQKGIIEEQAQIDILFMKLRNAKKGTDEYNSAKNNIMSQYGQYLKGLGDEKKALDDVGLAYKTISENAIEAAKSRALSAAVESETAIFGENALSLQKKAKEILVGKYGEVQGNKLNAALAGYLSGKDDKIPNEVKQRLIDGFAVNTKDWNVLMGDYSAKQKLDGYNPLENIRNQRKDLDKNLKDVVKSYMDVYGINMGNIDLGSGKPKTAESGTTLSESEKNKLAKEAARLKEEAAERQRKIDEINKDAIQNLKDGQLEIDQAKISAMDDGLSKELAQIDLNYQRMKAENAKRLDEMIQAEADKQELLWEAANPELVKKGEKFNRSSVGVKSLSESQLAQIEEFYKVASNLRLSEGIKANQKEQESILKATKETEERKTDISIKAVRLRSDLEDVEMKNARFLWASDKKKKELENRLKYLNEEKEILENTKFPDGETANQLSDVNIEIKNIRNQLELISTEKLNEVLDTFQGITSELSRLDGDLGDMFSSVGSQLGNLKGMLNGTASVAEVTSSAIGIVVDMVNMVSQSAKERKESEKDYYQNSIDLAHQYALALNEQLRIQTQLSENGFVKNYSGQITDSFNALTDATLKYDEAIQKLAGGQVKTGQKNAIDWGKVAKSGITSGFLGAGVALLGGKTKEDVFSDLLKTYPTLVDQNGKLNSSLAKTLIETNQLNDETKAIVQNAIDWMDAMEQANQQISSIVNELAGDLGNSLKESVVGAWKAGEDASDSMFKAASQSLESFVTNMIYSTVFSGVFDQFKNDLKESLTGDRNIVDDYSIFMENFIKQKGEFNTQMDAVKALSEKYGFSIGNNETDSNVSTTPKGIAQASQDSVDELNGRFTAVQGHTYKISESMQIGVEVWRNQLTVLNRIDVNTARLEGVEKGIGSMKVTLDDIFTKGIRIK